MFTGIIEEIGTVVSMQRTGKGYELAVEAHRVLAGTEPGDSIAVNGVCLTVTGLTSHSFRVGVSAETRSRSNLAVLSRGDQVNLERALTPASRLGGHFVQGHVDDLGTVNAFRKDEDSRWVTINAPDTLMRYVVPKGFIALDGISLTVVDVHQSSFTVMLVPYTQAHISLARQRVGYRVNIEVDILGKYVEKFLAQRSAQGLGITPEFLAEHGFI